MSPTPTDPPGNVVDMSCDDEGHADHELTISPGASGRPDFSAAWPLKLVSCDLSNDFFGREAVVKPVTAVEKAVLTESKKDGYDEDDDDIGFFYTECALNDSSDVFARPGFTLSSEQIPDMIATLLLCPNHPLAAKWRSALKRGQREVTLQEDGRVFGAGTYRVGKDIRPGTYVARDVQGCYWERQNRNGETIDNYFVNGAKRVQVTIRSSDYGFSTSGCGTWRPA
ncbi:hypothetical protein ABZ541_29055 [Micromonospora sediminicola]|uniref:hypothetical protein n=1 Tax=Micromonospora sediminicola TaxID=946078 RepID=UPI0033CEAE89